MIHCLDPYALIGSKAAESAAAMIGALSSTPSAIARKESGCLVAKYGPQHSSTQEDAERIRLSLRHATVGRRARFDDYHSPPGGIPQVPHQMLAQVGW